jgi:adenine-specific DNA methylase
VFRECRRVLKSDGLLAFTFHHSKVEAWQAVLEALRGAAFKVVATHPVKAELSVAAPKSQTKAPIDIDCIIVCRKAEALNGEHPTEADWRATAAGVIRRFNAAGTMLSKGDVRVVLMGEYLKASTTTAVGSIEEFAAAADELHEGQKPGEKPTDPQLLLF